MYYPKNKILTDQYTEGKQYIVKSNGIEYIGYFYILSDGKIFSGKNPQYSPSNELIKYNNFSIDNITDPVVLDYNKLKKGTKIEKILTYSIIPTYYPNPSNKDYEIGIITRYFVKPINGTSISIKEINLDVYKSIFYKKGEFDDVLNTVTKIPWQIKGPIFDLYQGNIIITPGIIDTNYRQIKLVEGNFPGLFNYLKNLKEFSR